MSRRGPFLAPHDLTKVIQTRSLQWIYENASDMMKSEREVPIVYGGMLYEPSTKAVFKDQESLSTASIICFYTFASF